MEINAAALAAIRERTGLTKAELAREAGLSKGHVGDLERKRRRTCTRTTVEALAEALEVDWTALVMSNGDGEAS